MTNLPSHLLAVNITPAGTYAPPSSTSTPVSVLTSFGDYAITLLLMIGGALAVIYLIWAGIQYIQAGGDASKAKAARASIINAIIGIVVILSTYTIIRFAGSIANNIVSSP